MENYIGRIQEIKLSIREDMVKSNKNDQKILYKAYLDLCTIQYNLRECVKKSA